MSPRLFTKVGFDLPSPPAKRRKESWESRETKVPPWERGSAEVTQVMLGMAGDRRGVPPEEQWLLHWEKGLF